LGNEIPHNIIAISDMVIPWKIVFGQLRWCSISTFVQYAMYFPCLMK
jgi:hypothetical protein